MFYKPPARLLSPPWKRTFTGSPRSQERSRREQPLARHLGGLKEEKKKIKLNNKAEKDGINLRHGTWVASHPGATILASVAVCGLFSLGLLNFQQETNMVRLWLPQVREKVQNIWETKSTGVRLRAAHGLVVGERSNRRGI